MAIKPNLRQSQVQRLSLTPALRQSINILALSDRQLTEMIESELAENPLLSELSTKSAGNSADYQYALDQVAAKPSLAEHLHTQIALSTEPQQILQIADYLAADLTSQGFLPESDDDIAVNLSVDITELRRAIDVLQSCEPVGIGARDLVECLSLQLKSRRIAANSREILLENLSLFANSDWSALKRRTQLPLPDLKDLAHLLQSLSPFPASDFAADVSETLYPDVQVSVNTAGGFNVELLHSTAPSLTVDESLFDTAKRADPSALSYLRSNATRANALITAIEARSKTVLRVCREIVQFQHRFFTHGHDHLQPQTQAELAVSLKLHPSTIARALANKALTCDFGTFPLKFFFTSSVNSLGHTDPQSAYVIQQEIRRMIAAESPEKTLSDGQITQTLRQDGVDIARRTVAKYRQCLNIPSSVQRRRSKRKL